MASERSEGTSLLLMRPKKNPLPSRPRVSNATLHCPGLTQPRNAYLCVCDIIDGLPTDRIQLAADYNFGNYIPSWKLAVSLVIRPTAVGGIVWGLWSMGDDCVGYSKDGDKKDKNGCISNAITSFLSISVMYYDDFFVQMARTLRITSVVAATELFGNAGIREFFENHPTAQAPGPFVPTPNTEEIEMGNMERRGLLEARMVDALADVEGALSARLGHEVRSIGFWDGSMPGEPARRDEDKEYVPVFAMRRGNHDFHVAVTGGGPGGDVGDAADSSAANSTRVRIGLGPGPKTELNKRRLLRARDMEYEEVDLVEEFGFNEVYFDKGGIEGFVESDFDPDSEDDHPTTYEDMEWLRALLECSLDPGLREQDPPGLWWSILDQGGRKTVATGAVAAFYPEQPSMMQYMGRGTHLSQDERCMVNDDWFD